MNSGEYSLQGASLIAAIGQGILDSTLEELYGEDALLPQRERYLNLAQAFCEMFGTAGDVNFFSCAGRTELAGNHTDHQNGHVLAAAIDQDMIALVRPRNDRLVRCYSCNFEALIDVDLVDLAARPPERDTSASLIRGIAAGLAERNRSYGGFDGMVISDVAIGSGLSTSAAFEMLIATIQNHLYNDATIDPIPLAQIGQYAENQFFGKPCGLMDQIACGHGGAVAIDFGAAQESAGVEIEALPFRPRDWGLQLLVVNTGGTHRDLTPDYAAIPNEMGAVAHYFGQPTLHRVSPSALRAAIPILRARLGDRSVLRALHFFAEDRRVTEMAVALRSGDAARYIGLMRDSGLSSWTLLQNCWSPTSPKRQGISLALALTDEFLRTHEQSLAACRVHGGGFAGVIQLLLGREYVDRYREAIEPIFGVGSVVPLHIRRRGATIVGRSMPPVG